MKDSIVEEIHRFRAEYAGRFNHDTHAICEDLRKRQEDSGRKVVGWDAKRKRLVEVKRPKTVRAKPLVA